MPSDGFGIMVKEKQELLPFSRWMINAVVAAEERWKSAQFLRRAAVIAGSFFNCSTPMAPDSSIGRTL